MSSDNSKFLKQESASNEILNSILEKLKRIPNTTHVVNNINHLNAITVPMIGAKNISFGDAKNANGMQGFVPTPAVTDARKFLRGDGTWQSVITEVNPLKSTYINFDDYTNAGDRYAHIYMAPANGGNTVDVIKYSKHLDFGRYGITMSDNIQRLHTLLKIKQDNKSVGTGIMFLSENTNMGSTVLFANLQSGGKRVHVKMPAVNGTLLTDSGFTSYGTIEVKTDTGITSWRQGLLMQRSTAGHAIICLGASDVSKIGVTTEYVDINNGKYPKDGWFLRSTYNSVNEKDLFSIAYRGYLNPTLDENCSAIWGNKDGTWIISKDLSVLRDLTVARDIRALDRLRVGNNLIIGSGETAFYVRADTNWDTLSNVTKKSALFIAAGFDSFKFRMSSSQVDLLYKNSSVFYVNDLQISTLSENVDQTTYNKIAVNATIKETDIDKVASRGGKLKLLARTYTYNSKSKRTPYGDITLENRHGQLWLSNSACAYNIGIDFYNNNWNILKTASGPLINAKKFKMHIGEIYINRDEDEDESISLTNSKYVYKTNNVANVTEIGYRLVTSKPITLQSGVPTPVATPTSHADDASGYARYYRPIIVSSGSTPNGGTSGDIWINYKT